MVATTYILQSLKDSRTYVGSTSDFNRRLKQHNDGHVISTKHRIPFKILFVEEFALLVHARKREKWWKSGAGRKKLKEFFKQNK